MIKYYYYARKFTEICLTSKSGSKPIETKEEVYIQASNFNDQGYIIPLKAFCLSYKEDNTIYFFEIHFSVKVSMEDLAEITEEAFDKAYNKGIDEGIPFPIPTIDNN